MVLCSPSMRLGHASIAITLDTYAHALPNMQQIAIDALQQVLFSPLVTAS